MALHGREAGHLPQQFIPGENHKAQELGSADAQVEEAMAIAKRQNSQPEIGLATRIAKMDAMNVNTALDFLDGLSQHEREQYLQAEKVSKKRTGVLGRYGW